MEISLSVNPCRICGDEVHPTNDASLVHIYTEWCLTTDYAQSAHIYPTPVDGRICPGDVETARDMSHLYGASWRAFTQIWNHVSGLCYDPGVAVALYRRARRRVMYCHICGRPVFCQNSVGYHLAEALSVPKINAARGEHLLPVTGETPCPGRPDLARLLDADYAASLPDADDRTFAQYFRQVHEDALLLPPGMAFGPKLPPEFFSD